MLAAASYRVCVCMRDCLLVTRSTYALRMLVTWYDRDMARPNTSAALSDKMAYRCIPQLLGNDKHGTILWKIFAATISQTCNSMRRTVTAG